MKRGALKAFREFLNESFKDCKKWKHNQYHQEKRGYGDYLYFQDRGMFDSLLSEAFMGEVHQDRFEGFDWKKWK